MNQPVKHLISLAALLGLALIATGCAAAAAYPISAAASLFSPAGAIEIHNQTAVRLDQPNFVVVRTNVTGTSKGFALVGLITMVPAKFSTAMDRFYVNAAVEQGKPQAFANIVMEKSSTFWILFSIPQVSVRADVVEFIPPLTDDNSPGPDMTARPEEVSTPAPRSHL